MIRSVYTTLLYIAVFLPSLLCISVTEKYTERKRYVFFLFACISILIPTLFAGFRGKEVGTDVMVYAVPEFRRCMLYGSWSRYLKVTSTDIGYAFLVAFSALIGKSFNWLLILTEFLQLLPIYILAYRLRKKITMSHVLLAFFFMHYIIGFNVMRQSIAASFVLLAYVEFLYKNRIRGILCIGIAFLFHSTAIIGVLFLFVGVVMYSIENRRVRNTLVFLGTFLIIFLMIKWQDIIGMFVLLNLLPADKMQVYIDVFSGVSVGDKAYMFEVSFSQRLEVLLKGVYWMVPVLCMVLKRGKKKMDFDVLKQDKLVSSVVAVTLIAVLINYLVLFLFHSAYGYRVAIYAEYFFVILIPLVCGRHRVLTTLDHQLSIKLTYPEIINYGLLFISFYVLFMYYGQHETLPFYFQIY